MSVPVATIRDTLRAGFLGAGIARPSRTAAFSSLNIALRGSAIDCVFKYADELRHRHEIERVILDGLSPELLAAYWVMVYLRSTSGLVEYNGVVQMNARILRCPEDTITVLFEDSHESSASPLPPGIDAAIVERPRSAHTDPQIYVARLRLDTGDWVSGYAAKYVVHGEEVWGADAIERYAILRARQRCGLSLQKAVREGGFLDVA